MSYGLLLVSVVAFTAGFCLRWAIECRNLITMRNMTFTKSAALWLSIFAGLCAGVAALQWLVEAL